VRVIECEQGSEQWHTLRRGVITASHAHCLLTPAKLKTYQYVILAEKLTGLKKPLLQSGAMEWGTSQESFARVWYEVTTQQKVQEIGFCFHQTEDIVGCSPDGLIKDDGLIEIKCPGSEKHLEYIVAGPSSEYTAQIQLQLLVTGRKWCDFVSYDPRMPSHLEGHITRVERDEAMILKLERGIQSIKNFITEFTYHHE